MNLKAFAIFFVLFMLAACSGSDRLVTLKSSDGIQRTVIRVEIADNAAEHARGLMGRDHLDADAGMLFLFEAPQVLTFWMKNTLIPLDVIFFEADGRFISSSTMTPCMADPCATYTSAGPALYALEVNAGFVGQNGIGEGWTLELR